MWSQAESQYIDSDDHYEYQDEVNITLAGYVWSLQREVRDLRRMTPALQEAIVGLAGASIDNREQS